MKNAKQITLSIVLIVVTILSLPALSFSADDTDGEYSSMVAHLGPKALIPPGHYSIIANYADNYLSQLVTNQADLVAYHNQVFANLVKTNTLNNFFILDVRECTDYCAGHIPNAVNIPVRTVAKPWNLERLPTDKAILAVCYTGQVGGQTTSILNTLGYDAYNLKFGMLSVRSATAVKVGAVAQTVNGYGYPLETCDPVTYCK